MTSASYDGAGMRVSTTTTPSGGSPITQGYVWSGDNLLMDGTNAYIYTTGSTPAEQVNLANGTITYLSSDLTESVRGTVNSAGTLTGTTSYDAWGNPTTTGGLTGSTPFGFAGGYTDGDGLVYFPSRYYDPQTGQFTSVDPNLAESLQPYAFDSNDPMASPDGRPGGGNGDGTPLTKSQLHRAARWALVHLNGDYHFTFDDCTDFVSSALHFGGHDPMNRDANVRRTQDDRYWFYYRYKQYGPGGWNWVWATAWSNSWTVSHALCDHFRILASRRIRNPSKARPGEIVFGSYTGDSFPDIAHAGIITSMRGSQPMISQHSASLTESLKTWYKHGITHVWIYWPDEY